MTLKFSFRRSVSPSLMNMWYEILAIAGSIVFSTDPDAIVWKFTSNGIYSVQSLYAVVNFRGVKPIHPPAIWELCIPSRVQVFLWLLSNNKLLTRDNLAKRREVNEKSCVFCDEPESISHLFFDCCVVNIMWELCSSIFGIQLSGGFENVAKWWLSRKKHAVLNMCTSAVLWCIWNMRNVFLFSGGGLVRCKEAVAQGGGYVEKMALSLHGRKRAATEGGCPADGGKNQRTFEDHVGFARVIHCSADNQLGAAAGTTFTKLWRASHA